MPRPLKATLYISDSEETPVVAAGPYCKAGDAHISFDRTEKIYQLEKERHAAPSFSTPAGVSGGVAGNGDHSFLKSVGKSSVSPRIVVPSADDVRKGLKGQHSKDEIKELLRSHEFRSCCVTMTVEMNDPRAWALDWGRFRFSYQYPPASVLEFSPESLTSPANLQKTGSGSFTISALLTGNIAGGAGASGGPSYTATKGWSASFSAMIEYLKGSLASYEIGKQVLTWDLYPERAIALPEGLGHTTVASGAALFGFPKMKDTPDVDVTFEGKARRPNRRTFVPRPIEPPPLGSFPLKPDK